MKNKIHTAFTLIELLTVIAIIAILMGLVISVAGMVQTKSSRDRASAEIAALSAAMESYKADNGIYPMGTASDALERSTGSPKAYAASASSYKPASLELYKALSGDENANFAREGDERQNTVYFEFETKKGMVEGASNRNVTAIIDPWGDSYGYSTAYAAALQNATSSVPAATDVGYNPTFDLWSLAGDKATGSNPEKWVKNW